MSIGPLLSKPFLAFQLKHIGDFLHTLPALGWLGAQSGSPVDVVVTPKIAELAQNHPWVGRTRILDRGGGIRQMVELAREIRGHNYGTAFIFDGQTRSIVTSYLGRIKQRVGASHLYPLGGWAALYTKDVELGPAWPQASQAKRSQEMVATWWGKPGAELQPGPLPPPRLEETHRKVARGLLAEIPGIGPAIGLTLQGMQPEKFWPLAHFATVCQSLWRDYKARLFVTGGPNESDGARALARAAGVPVANFCGRTGLLELVALAELSDLFVTVDTGTAHLVALTRTPLISIYIWTSPALWPPQSPHTRLLVYDWALQRFNLGFDDGPWHRAPVVTPEMVLNEAAHLLAPPGQKIET